MTNTFSDMMRLIDLSEHDVANVRALGPVVVPHFSVILDHFYGALMREPSTRRAFPGGEAQVADQRTQLASWLDELFKNPFGKTHHARAFRVGTAHVAAGLDQHLMVVGIELLWQAIEVAIRKMKVDEVDAKLTSLHKSLMVELAIMLESYKQSHAEQVRRSERSVVAEQLTRAEHLAEIGQLAASLAHEIKNPLAGISGAIQIIREAMPAEDEHQPILTEILRQVKRLDATVKDLLLYARPTPPQWNEFSMDQAIHRVLTFLREEPALHGLTVQYAGAPAGAIVYADDAQIDQLLMNLIINAAHASEAGSAIQVQVSIDSDFVRLMVIDTGVGMTKEVCEQAYDPFFTTKARGTGLGLSICRKIAETHGGKIEMKSEQGCGTTVAIDLPRSGSDEEEAGTL